MEVSFRQSRVVVRDGTEIAYYICGSGPGRLVLAPGLGTPFITWKHLLRDTAERFVTLTWDLRGTYASSRPKDQSRLGIEDHVADMLAICEVAGFERFALLGWSMGVEIALEFAYRFPNSVLCLVLVAGTYEHVIETAIRVPSRGRVLKQVLRAMQWAAPKVQPLIYMALGSHATLRLLGLSGFVKHNLEFFGELVREFRHLDFATYLRLVQQMNQHSADPYLHEINIPTLVIAGTHDLVTPWQKMEMIHKKIKGSEFFLVPNGSHYLLIEYPEVVNLKILKFLEANYSQPKVSALSPSSPGEPNEAPPLPGSPRRKVGEDKKGTEGP